MITKFAPQPGPQEKFLSSEADIVIYGGAAGGGKTRGLLMEGGRHSYVRNFNAVIFRLSYGDITNPGGLWDDSYEIYPHLGATPRQSALTWSWPSGAKIMFSHFQHPKYKANWQGSQICLIGWDELTHFSQDIFFYMLSRNRSTCGVKPYIRCTCNPDPDSWVRGFIDWWIGEDGYPIPERSGVIRYFVRENGEIKWYDNRKEIPKKLRLLAKSCTFIPASLADNPALTRKDPAYMANLMALPTHERERLLGGNWNVRLVAGMYFKREWFEVVKAAPASGYVVRYWDRAATEPSETNSDPDWTVGTKIRFVGGVAYVEDVIRFRGTPDKVKKTIRNTASQDGDECTVVLEEDPGQAGKSDVDTLTKYLAGFTVRTQRVDKKKEIRARPASAQAEAGNIKLVKGPWNSTFLAELEQFPEGNHDDQVDTLSGGYNYITLAIREPRIRYVRM